jgi:chemotaxis protein CheD
MLAATMMLCDARDDDPLRVADVSVPRRAVYLQPGMLHASAAPCALTTIVGSCVAVCLHDAEARVGGVNHYLLPLPLRSGDDLRYGATAIPRLVHEVLQLGARHDRLEAGIFGGAHIGAITLPPVEHLHLGSQNAQIARELLTQEGIRIAIEDVEGNRARKIVFHTDAGMVWLRTL